MGLDGIELIMAVEEEFAIAIPDADAAQCVTVGKLVDLIDARLRHSVAEPCPSQRGFYVVRRELMSLLGLARTAIKPGTLLVDLIAREKRRTLWPQLLQALTAGRTEWPRLVRPRWLTVLVVVVVPLAACTALAISTGSLGLALLLGCLVVIIGDRLSVPWKREFPRGFGQVQDLIKFVTTLNARIWSKDEVFERLRTIIVEQLGVEASQVTLDADFVHDLGLG